MLPHVRHRSSSSSLQLPADVAASLAQQSNSNPHSRRGSIQMEGMPPAHPSLAQQQAYTAQHNPSLASLPPAASQFSTVPPALPPTSGVAADTGFRFDPLIGQGSLELSSGFHIGQAQKQIHHPATAGSRATSRRHSASNSTTHTPVGGRTPLLGRTPTGGRTPLKHGLHERGNKSDHSGSSGHLPGFHTVDPRSQRCGVLPRLLVLVLLLVLSGAAFWAGAGGGSGGSVAPPLMANIHPGSSSRSTVQHAASEWDEGALVDAPQQQQLSSSGAPAGLHLLIRVLSSGAQFHLELDRLLTSLREADYSVSAGEPEPTIDVELLVDFPPGLLLPIMPSAGASGNDSAEATARLHALIHSPEYQALKFEHDLTAILARNFATVQWPYGSVRCRLLDQSSAANEGGSFNAFMAWAPHPRRNEWALLLRENNVVSPLFFQAIRRIINTHFAPPTTQAGEAAGQPSILQPDAVLGALLEPTEMVLGLRSSPGGSPPNFFDPSLRPESLVWAALPPGMKASPPRQGVLFYAQSLVGFGAGARTDVRGATATVFEQEFSGGLGGLLLRASAYTEFKKFVSALGLLQPSPDSTRASEEPGAPLLDVYARANNAEEQCTPGLVSDAWARGSGGDLTSQLAALPPLGSSSNNNDDMDDLQGAVGRAALRALHHSRMHNPWFLFSLLHRFLYERNMYVISWMPPPGKNEALVSSGSYVLPHVHQHEHVGTHGAHGHGEKDEEAAERQHALALTHLDREALPLAPLQRTLIHRESNLFSEALPAPTTLPLLFDFSYASSPLASTSASSRSELVPSPDACALLLPPSSSSGSVPPSPPSPPPNLHPTREQQEKINHDREVMRLAREQAMQASREAAGSQLGGDAQQEAEGQGGGAWPLPAALNPAFSTDGKGTTGSAAGASGVASSLSSLSSTELVHAALRTAESHRTNISLCLYISGSPRNTDNEGFPLLDLHAPDAPRLTNASELFANTTDLQTACFEEYEADFELSLARPNLPGDTVFRVRRRHEHAKETLAELLAFMREELAKKDLIDMLKEQLQIHQDSEQEARDRALLEKYLSKQRAKQGKKGKDAAKNQKAAAEEKKAADAQEAKTAAALTKALAEAAAASENARLLQAKFAATSRASELRLRTAREQAAKRNAGKNLTPKQQAALKKAEEAAALEEQDRLDLEEEAMEQAVQAAAKAQEKAQAAQQAADEALAAKRRTGDGEVESEEEYQRLLAAMKAHKRERQHDPLFMG